MKTLSVLGICAALVVGSANATDFEYINLGVGNVLAINNSNQAVGNKSYTATLWNINDNNKVETISLMNGRQGFEGTATDINNKGDILVNVVDWDSKIYGLYISDNKTFVIQPPDKAENGARGFELNNNGTFIGKSSLGDVIWDNPANPQLLNTRIYGPDAEKNQFVNGINDYNQTVGQVGFFGSGESRAVYFDDKGNPVDIGKGFDWAIRSTAIDINNKGQILATGVGFEGGGRSFIWDNGHIQSLKSDGGRSEGVAINEHGIVVGIQFSDVDIHDPNYFSLATRAVMWDGHNQYDLNAMIDPAIREAGWVLISANDINDNGWIVGQAFNASLHQIQSYVLATDNPISPIPEPSTYLMLLAGLGLLGFVGSRNLLKTNV